MYQTEKNAVPNPAEYELVLYVDIQKSYPPPSLSRNSQRTSADQLFRETIPLNCRQTVVQHFCGLNGPVWIFDEYIEDSLAVGPGALMPGN